MVKRLRHQQTIPPSGGIPTRKILTDTFDGLGTLNYNGDYSGALKTIAYQPTGRFEMASFLITISSPAKTYQDGFGSISGGLTNGILFYFHNKSGIDIPIITDVPIKKTYQYCNVTPDADTTDFDGTAQTFRVFIDMKKQYGSNFPINPGEQIKVTLNDNFSTLVNHSFAIFGNVFET